VFKFNANVRAFPQPHACQAVGLSNASLRKDQMIVVSFERVVMLIRGYASKSLQPFDDFPGLALGGFFWNQQVRGLKGVQYRCYPYDYQSTVLVNSVKINVKRLPSSTHSQFVDLAISEM